jgi:hypothetical protein
MRKAAGSGLALALVLAIAPGASTSARAAELSFSTVLGEEVLRNGFLDPGESLTLDLSATYAAGEQAVNYQVDLLLSGDPNAFAFAPQSPAPFGSPGSAACAAPQPDLLRCFGNTDLLTDPNARVGSPSAQVTAPLGSIQVQALGALGDSLTVDPGPFFTEELVSDPNGMLVGSSLPFVPLGLDAGGHVLDIAIGADPGADTDGDTVLDDGNGSGIAGDAPCSGGQTAGCDDNCPFESNADQADPGGTATAGPDGIGTVCQCGDVSDDGRLTLVDFGQIRGFFLSGGTTPPTASFVADKCDVSGDQQCTLTDFGRVRGAFLAGVNHNPIIIQGCPPAIP